MKAFFHTIQEFFRRFWNRRPEGRTEADMAEQELFPQANTKNALPVARVRENTGAFEETRLFDAAQVQQARSGLLEETDALEDEDEAQSEPIFTEKVRRHPFVLSLLFSTVRLVLVGGVLLGFALLGAAFGIAKAYVETTPTMDTAQLTKSDRTSFLYDMDGNLITTIADVEYRDWVDIEDIPRLLQQAFISIEDIRFYKHSGVDVKRLFSAALEILDNRNASGGSTITQQLIKNKILSNERNYKRKIREAYLALELEQIMEKDDILEAYLNDIHLGESNYGVKTAAKDYFGKELSELTIRECAMLAGLTQNPYYYNPRLNKYRREASYWEGTMERTDRVLGNMYEAGYITKAEYEAALKEDVHIVEVSEQKQMYDMPYFVEYAIRDVVTHLLAQRELPDTKINREMLENELRTGGYHIYTTVDTQMQHLVQDTLSNWDNYPDLQDPTYDVRSETNADGSVITTRQPQSSAVVFDYHTGELRAIIGGRDTPTIYKGLNRAYQSYMEVGSSIKPLAVYGPALDNGASPTSVIANMPGPIEGWDTEKGYPSGGLSTTGPVTIRKGIVSSLNVVAARTLFEHSSTEIGAQYLINLGANPSRVNADGAGLALGTSGLTTIQMAAAYGAIGAQGEYKEPLSFRRVVDSSGNLIISADDVRQTRQVYKKSTAYLLADMLTEAVNRGTGTSAKIENMTVAGKTGTNSYYRSVYFAGLTPYYSASVWIGHDDPKCLLKNQTYGGSYAAPLWQAFMEPIHEGLPNKNIINESPADLGLVKKTTCTVSGLLATEACFVDTGGHTPVTDWVAEEHAPTIPCDMHAAMTLCSDSGQVATVYCPQTSVSPGSVVLVAPGSYFDQFPDDVLRAGISNFVRTPYSLEEYMEYGASGSSCVLHGAGGNEGYQQGNLNLRWEAANLRDEIISYINSKSLPTDTYNMLLEHARLLNGVVGSTNADMINSRIWAAEQAYAGVRNTYGR